MSRSAVVLLALAPTVTLAAEPDCENTQFLDNGACISESASLDATVTTTEDTLVAAGAYVGPFIALDDVYIAPNAILDGWLAHNVQPLTVGPGTVVGRSTTIGTDHILGADTTLARSVTSGPRLTTGTGVSVGYASILGADVTLDDGAVVGNHVQVGDYTYVGPSAVLARGITVTHAPSLAERSQIMGTVGPESILGSSVLVAATARVRKNATIESGVQVMDGARIGRDVTIETGATVYGRVAANGTVPAGSTVPHGWTVRRGESFLGNGSIEVCNNGLDDDNDALIDCDDTTCMTDPVCINAAPTSGIWAPSTANPRAGEDDLQCSASVAPTDINGDDLTISVSWTVDGQTWTGSTSNTEHAGDTIAPADLVVGQTWKCTATVSDGTETVTSNNSVAAVVMDAFTGTIQTFPLGDPSSPFGVDVDFVGIGAGSFTMGCLPGRDDVGLSDCSWVGSRDVTLTHDFWMSTEEVTVANFARVRGETSWSGGSRPQGDVNWSDAAWYANTVSINHGFTPCYVCTGEYDEDDEDALACQLIDRGPYACTGYRMPTTAEWEYAARAGGDFQFSGSNTLDTVAWHSGNAGGQTKNVGTKTPNAWGLYDMTGNVTEWMTDGRAVPYAGSAVTDPVEPPGGSQAKRAWRGGAYSQSASSQRLSMVSDIAPNSRFPLIGFRLARVLHDTAAPTPGDWVVTNSVNPVCTALVAPEDTDVSDVITTTITWFVDGVEWTGTTSTTHIDGDTLSLVGAHAVWCQAVVDDGTFEVFATPTDPIVTAPVTSIAGTSLSVPLPGAVTMDFVGIPVGVHEVGCVDGRDASACHSTASEDNYTSVLTRETWFGTTEVTQEQWAALAVQNPGISHFDGSPGADAGDTAPVESLKTSDAFWYANALSIQEGYTACYTCSGANGYGAADSGSAPSCYLSPNVIDTCDGYRLPTDAEWEWAGRAQQSYAHAGSNTATTVGWVKENAGSTTHPVGQKPANAFGLFDMTGNVWEMTTDHRIDSEVPRVGIDFMHTNGSGYGAFFSSGTRGLSWDFQEFYPSLMSEGAITSSGRSDTGFRLVRSVYE